MADRKISQLDARTTSQLADSDSYIVESGSLGTGRTTFTNLRSKLIGTSSIDQIVEDATVTSAINRLNAIIGANAQCSHNAYYRGAQLTNFSTRYAPFIADGTFKNMYIGDYFQTTSGNTTITWRIAAFDSYMGVGQSGGVTTHHIVVVPDAPLYNAAMNDTDTTSGGYTGSKMYTDNLAQAVTMAENSFGSSHVLEHSMWLCRGVTNGAPTSVTWFNVKATLMTEQNVYGGKIFGTANTGATDLELGTGDSSIFPLFLYNPSARISNQYWLRDIVSASKFASVTATGTAHRTAASSSTGVRPAFCIC